MEKIKSKKATLLTNIAIAIGMILISTAIGLMFQGFKLFSSFPFYLKYVSFGCSYGFAFWLGNWYISTLIEKIDWTKNPKRANLISFLLMLFYGIAVSILIPYIFDRFVWGMTGKDIFYDVLAKALMTIFLDQIVIYFYYSTFITNHWIKTIEKNEELKRENLIARYEALKNQVNPHFLFNSLNTLSGMIEQKPEQATDYVKKLSDIYRYVLEQNDKELVSLKDELKFVGDYIYLSKLRFGDGLIFDLKLLHDETIRVVPLGLQMLVENAIKHNIITDDMPLRIEMFSEDGFVIVKNNIQVKKTLNSDKDRLGLENLKKRYAYLSDANVEVIASDRNFTVKLPIIEP